MPPPIGVPPASSPPTPFAAPVPPPVGGVGSGPGGEAALGASDLKAPSSDLPSQPDATLTLASPERLDAAWALKPKKNIVSLDLVGTGWGLIQGGAVFPLLYERAISRSLSLVFLVELAHKDGTQGSYDTFAVGGGGRYYLAKDAPEGLFGSAVVHLGGQVHRITMSPVFFVEPLVGYTKVIKSFALSGLVGFYAGANASGPVAGPSLLGTVGYTF